MVKNNKVLSILYYIKEISIRPKVTMVRIVSEVPFRKGIIFIFLIGLVISFSLIPSVVLTVGKYGNYANIIERRNIVIGTCLASIILVSILLLSFWLFISFAFFDRARRKGSKITFRQISSCVSFAQVPFVLFPILGFTIFRVMRFGLNNQIPSGIIDLISNAIYGLFHIGTIIFIIIWWLILLLQARRVSLLFTENLSK